MAQDDAHGLFSSGGESYILILYFILFLFLFFLVCYGVCCGIPGIFSRFCFATSVRRRCGIFGCCCAFDTAAYQREQESLRRLQELRRVHRLRQMEELRAAAAAAGGGASPGVMMGGGLDPAVVRAMNAHPNSIGMFASRHSPPFYGGSAMGERTNLASWSPSADIELRRLAFADARHGTQNPFGNVHSMWAAYQQMNSLGILVLPHTRDDDRGAEGEVHIRESLSSEERRNILESILEFKPFHAQSDHCRGDLDKAIGEENRSNGTIQGPFENEPCGTSQNAVDDGAEVEGKASADVFTKEGGGDDADSSSSVASHGAKLAAVKSADCETSEVAEETAKSMALPVDSVGVPNLAETTCAICLDEFEEGELLNNATGECSHSFHKDCLIMWLERHDGCPTCRRTMVPESAWREETRAVADNNNGAAQGEAAEVPGEGPASAVQASDVVDVELG